MSPEDKQELDQYVQAIAKLLYKDADKSWLQTLGEIELVVREQLQEHVNPQIGIFLSEALQAQRRDVVVSFY